MISDDDFALAIAVLRKCLTPDPRPFYGGYVGLGENELCLDHTIPLTDEEVKLCQQIIGGK